MKFRLMIIIIIIFIVNLNYDSDNYFNMMDHGIIARISYFNADDPKQIGHNPPNLCAWGYIVKPNDKIVAISRDLIKLGLTNGSKIYIKEKGWFTVRSLMHQRFIKSIDIAITSGANLKERKNIALQNGIEYKHVIWHREKKC